MVIATEEMAFKTEKMAIATEEMVIATDAMALQKDFWSSKSFRKAFRTCRKATATYVHRRKSFFIIVPALSPQTKIPALTGRDNSFIPFRATTLFTIHYSPLIIGTECKWAWVSGSALPAATSFLFCRFFPYRSHKIV